MIHPINKFYYFDNKFYTTSDLNHLFSTEINCIYEVGKLIQGYFLFLEDHLQRLAHSIEIKSILYKIDYLYIKDVISKLYLKNGQIEGNVLLAVFPDAITPKFAACYIAHRYPHPSFYQQGSKLLSYSMERAEPNVKQSSVNNELRKKISHILADDEVFEVLLKNHENHITEGSKSNVFFIKENRLYTPLANEVLEGITRKKVFEICKKNRIHIYSEVILYNTLDQFDAAFLSGTSPGILPINQIDHLSFDIHHPVLKTIMKYYKQMTSDYLKKAGQ